MIHVTHKQMFFCLHSKQPPTQDMSWTSLAAHVAITPLANRLRWQLALKLANTNDYTIINQIASTCVRHSDFDFFLTKKHVGFFGGVGAQIKDMVGIRLGWVAKRSKRHKTQ